jgi:hypothetical protein
MPDYLVKKIEEQKNPDKSRTIIAELTPHKWASMEYDKDRKFKKAYKFWIPEQGLKDFNGFFELTFPNFSKYINEKYGDIEIKQGIHCGNEFINEFPCSIVNREHYDRGYFGLELLKKGNVFGNLIINYSNTKRNLMSDDIPKCCDCLNEFKYIPGMQPEIPDSDFFRIMKHSIMNLTYCDNFKQKIYKKVVLNEKEFNDALDIRINDRYENESWVRWSSDGIISRKNSKREDTHFLWSFWAGWGHGTTMKSLSCHRCSDSDDCKGFEKHWATENTEKGFYLYEPLNIKIPFP